jgi:hypothetical protein
VVGLTGKAGTLERPPKSKWASLPLLVEWGTIDGELAIAYVPRLRGGSLLGRRRLCH